MVSVPNTLLINGTNLRGGFAGIVVYGDMNLYAPGDRRGSDEIIPGYNGEIEAPGLPLAAYNFPISVFVRGATRGAMVANIHNAASVMVGTAHDGLFTMTRRLANAADDGYDEFYARGRFNTGLALQTLNSRTGQTVFQFRNLYGGWRRSSDNVLILP